MNARKMVLGSCIASIAFCSIASAQAYQMQKSNSIDLSSFFFGGGTSAYGVNPLSVAFEGNTAWVGGYNNSGANSSVGVVRIGNVLSAAPASAGLAGAGATQISTPFRGFQQMSARDGALYLAYDNNEGITPYIRRIDGTTGAQVWQVDSPAFGARPIAMSIDPRGGATDAGATGVPGLRFMSQDPFVSGGTLFSMRLSDGAMVYGPGSVIEQGGAGMFITAGQRAFATFSNRNIGFDEAGNFIMSTGVTHGAAVRTGDNSFVQYNNGATPGAGATGVLDKQGAQGQVVVNGEGINAEFMPKVGSTTADFMATNTRVPDAFNNIFNHVTQNGTVQTGLDARDVHLRNLDGTIRANAVNTLTGAEDYFGDRYSGQIKDLATGRDANGNPVLMVLSYGDRRLDIYQIEPTWAGTTGSWDTAANWNLNLIADGATQNARFPQAAGATTVTLNSNRTTKLLKFDSTSAYTITGTGTLTMDAPLGRAANIAVLQGNHTVAVPVVALKGTDLRVPAASTLTLSGGLTGVGATKRDLGVAEVKHIRVSALNVAEGTLKVIGTGNDATSRTASLQIANAAGVYTAKFDLEKAGLIVDYTTTNPEADIAQAIASARAGGAWTGNGLTSSNAAAQPSRYAVGFAQAAELGLTSFGGLNVTGPAVVARGTLLGDANLDAIVNFDDLLRLAQSYDPSGSGKRWAQGDGNYDGVVNFDDLLSLAQNYGLTALADGGVGTNASMAASFAADWALAQTLVPEPATLGAIAFALPLLRRRR